VRANTCSRGRAGQCNGQLSRSSRSQLTRVEPSWNIRRKSSWSSSRAQIATDRSFCSTRSISGSTLSALTLLLGRQEQHLACTKFEWWGDGMVICLQQGTNVYIWPSWSYCHPIISCFIKIQNGSAFLVLAYPRCPGKRPLNGFCVAVINAIIGLILNNLLHLYTISTNSSAT